MLREVDVEPGDGGLELGPGVVLEGELALDRARDRGGEQLFLVRARQSTECCEAGRVVVALHPLEGQVRPVGEHRFARAPAREVVVVRPRGGPIGGLVELDVERVPGRGVGAPRFEIVEAAVAPTGPTFLVVAPRVRAEQDATGLEGRREVAEDRGELATWHVEQGGICEDPVEAGGWQVEREEVLVQHLTIRVGARHGGEFARAVQANRLMTERGELP